MSNNKSNFFINFGIILLILAGIFLVYYFINLPPVIEYSFSNQEVELVNPKEIDWRIEISRIGVSAPIILNVDGNDEKAYLNVLENGVAHLAGTSLPGSEGNSFIFGHSSNYFFAPGEYKNVFEKLNELENDDPIEIKTNLNAYKYKVIEKKIVKPEDVEVTNNIDGKPETLTLMTCTPTGTSLRRLIIIAERI